MKLCSTVKQHDLVITQNKTIDYISLRNGESFDVDAVFAGNARNEVLDSVWIGSGYFQKFVGVPFDYFGEYLDRTMRNTTFEKDLIKGITSKERKIEYDEQRSLVWLPNISGDDLLLALLLVNRPHDLQHVESITHSIRIVTRNASTQFERNIHKRFPVTGQKEELVDYVKQKIAA